MLTRAQPNTRDDPTQLRKTKVPETGYLTLETSQDSQHMISEHKNSSVPQSAIEMEIGAPVIAFTGSRCSLSPTAEADPCRLDLTTMKERE